MFFTATASATAFALILVIHSFSSRKHSVMSSPKLKDEPPKEAPIEDTAPDISLKKVDMIEAQQLAHFMKEARKVLEKNPQIDAAVSVVDMDKERRREYLDELISYQTLKKNIYYFAIAYWLITIVLGLIATVLEKYITDIAMFVVWGVLLLSNIMMIITHSVYNKFKVERIIEKYAIKDESGKGVVIANPVSEQKKAEV